VRAAELVDYRGEGSLPMRAAPTEWPKRDCCTTCSAPAAHMISMSWSSKLNQFLVVIVELKVTSQPAAHIDLFLRLVRPDYLPEHEHGRKHETHAIFFIPGHKSLALTPPGSHRFVDARLWHSLISLGGLFDEFSSPGWVER